MSRQLEKTEKSGHQPRAESHIAHEHQVVRWTHNKKHYEVLCNVGEVENYRNGTTTDINAILATNQIFYSPHTKYLQPTEDELAAHLPGLTYDQIVDAILKKGDVQVSVSERTKQAAEKRTELVEYLHNNYIDSISKSALSQQQLNEWLDKIHHKFHTTGDNADRDVSVLAEEAAHIILQSGGAAAPRLHKASVIAEVYVPVAISAQANGEIRRFATIVNERDEVDRYFYTIEITPGKVEELQSKLNQLSKGNTGFTLKSVNEQQEQVIEPVESPLKGASLDGAKHGARQARKDSELKKTNRAISALADNLEEEDFAGQEQEPVARV